MQPPPRELCRVLFDALERSAGGAALGAALRAAYGGACVEYVRMRDAPHHESSRGSEFLDIQVQRCASLGASVGGVPHRDPPGVFRVCR